MANRGITHINDLQDFIDVNEIRLSFKYFGFEHGTEAFSGTVEVGSSLLTNSAIKAVIKEKIVANYTANPSENYAEWNDLLDSFTLLGGVA